MEETHNRLIQGGYKCLYQDEWCSVYRGKGLRIRVHHQSIDIAADYAFDRWANSRDFIINGHPANVTQLLHKARVEIALNRKIDPDYYQYPTTKVKELN